jgi:LuxR family maltose regulon positive regulatory protein
LEEHELFEQAARQYLLAGRTSQTYEMIEQCLYEIMLRGQFSRVLEWVEALPPQEVESRPRLCLAAAWSLAMSERHVEAAKLIAHIQRDPSADEEMHCEAAAIAAAAAYFADQLDEALAIIEPWFDALLRFRSNCRPSSPIKTPG